MALSVREFENNYVHEVYDLLAKYTEATKSRKWPVVENFIHSFDVGSTILDLGCGEGKYMDINGWYHMIGLERCAGYSKKVKDRGCSVIHCDITNIPLREECCDGIICVAVIHHLVTVERRVATLRELARVLSKGGRALITVWALENTYRKFSGQDVLVPIQIGEEQAPDVGIPNTEKAKSPKTPNVLPSFSIFPKIESFCSSLFSEFDSIKTKFNERVAWPFHNTLRDKGKQLGQWFDDNFPVFSFKQSRSGTQNFTMRRAQSECHISSKVNALTLNDQDKKEVMYASGEKTREHTPLCSKRLRAKVRSKSVGSRANENDFHRYYHVFQRGELGSLVSNSVPSLLVTAEYHQAGNWVVELIKVE